MDKIKPVYCYCFFHTPLIFDKGSTYMRAQDSFPLLVQYRGENHLTIVYKPDELKHGIAFTVIETRCQ